MFTKSRIPSAVEFKGSFMLANSAKSDEMQGLPLLADRPQMQVVCTNAATNTVKPQTTSPAMGAYQNNITHLTLLDTHRHKHRHTNKPCTCTERHKHTHTDTHTHTHTISFERRTL